MHYELNMRFKGERNYLQGGDFVMAIDRILEVEHGARLMQISFRTFARNHCMLHLQEPSGNAQVVAAGQAWGSNGGIRPFWVTEGDVPTTARYAFDEGSIVAASRIDGKGVRLEQSLPFSVIELVIAMTKSLAYALEPSVSGKWVFGQLRLDAPLPEGYGTIEVIQRAQLPNRFSNNQIIVDGYVLGEMRFIVGIP